MPLFARRVVRAQDLVWLLLFAALAYVASRPTPQEIGLLLFLGCIQIVEPRIPFFGTDRGRLAAVLLKLALSYALIGWTGGISSTYYVILLLPVISAATTLRWAWALGTTVLACLIYTSFLLYIDWTRYELTSDALNEVGLRVLFLAVVAYTTYQLAEENRVALRRYQTAAADLDTANENLQLAEAEVRRSERLAALGQLTAGLAHELRNPLGTMRASAEMLGRTVDPVVARELAGFISSEVDRTNSLITRFLDFARPVSLKLATSDVTRVVDDAITEFERHSPPLPILVHRNYVPDLPMIPADSELLQRVFYNLILNAAQATPPGGSVTVKVRTAGDFVEVSVIDRGRGIGKGHLEHVFNPFFTTRPEGVGLGLAIVSRIVDDHGGHVIVESEEGSGSVFRVFLPVRSSAAAAT